MAQAHNMPSTQVNAIQLQLNQRAQNKDASGFPRNDSSEGNLSTAPRQKARIITSIMKNNSQVTVYRGFQDERNSVFGRWTRIIPAFQQGSGKFYFGNAEAKAGSYYRGGKTSADQFVDLLPSGGNGNRRGPLLYGK